MKNINKIILIGHVGAKPEGRYTPKGISTASFSVATNELWYDSEKNKHEHTEWHTIVAFNKLADYATQNITKGSLVYIEGSIRSRLWKNNQQTEKRVSEVIAMEIVVLK